MNSFGCSSCIVPIYQRHYYLLASGVVHAEENLYVYLLDEAHAHPALRVISRRIKSLLPLARTVSTGDNAFPYDPHNSPAACHPSPTLPAQPPCMSTAELEEGGILEFVDVFIPRTLTYANQTASHLSAIRAYGKTIGWYTSGIPGGDNALQLGYLEYAAIRPRLLLGTAAWQAGSEASGAYRTPHSPPPTVPYTTHTQASRKHCW